MMAQFSSDSSVEAPRCGMAMTLSVLMTSSSGKIRHVARHDAVGDGLLQGRGIHEPSPGEIEEHHALLHDREFIGIDESLGVLILGDVQRDEIGLCQ